MRRASYASNSWSCPLSATAVMVHGAGGGGWEWALWAGVFAAGGLMVHAPDLSPVATGVADTRFDDYRAQVRAACEGVLPPCILIGASLGGLLALTAAAELPPAALVLINPVPPRGVEPRPSVAPQAPTIEWGRSALARTRRALPDADLATARWAHARWRDESGRVLNEALVGIDVPKPACPILVIASTDDTDVPLRTSRATAAALEADFVHIPGASHLGVLMGRSAPFAASLALAWLNGRLTQGNTA